MPNSARDLPADVSGLLQAWGRGDVGARDDLIPLVYAELRRQAAAWLRSERPEHTLQPTALVHEAYVRLMGQERVAWQNRAQFFGVAAQMMRRILVDHARARAAAKRPYGALRVAVSEDHAISAPIECELILLDQALGELESFDARQARILELRYFGGLSDKEIAAALDVSRSTITRECQSGRAWLYRRMTTGPSRRNV